MNAARDNNNVPTKILALDTDGKTIVRLVVDPVTHKIKVNNGTTGSNHGPTNALRDENFVPVLIGVSSSDFITPVVAYGDVTGALKIQST